MKRMLKESLLKKLIVNMEIFMFFSIVLTLVATRLPERYYYYKNWIYKERKWEKRGKFYQDVFKVKKWKDHLPELADFIKSVFPKKFIKGFKGEFISRYLTESCKAEFTHWCIIFSTVFFLIHDDISTFFYMLLIAMILNLPFIIIQRYNRPRLVAIMKHRGIEV